MTLGLSLWSLLSAVPSARAGSGQSEVAQGTKRVEKSSML